MEVKTYDGGCFNKANQTVTIWTVGDYCFFEFNEKGLKHIIFKSLNDFLDSNVIFEIEYNPDVYFEGVEDKEFLENERIYKEIEKFLVNYVKNLNKKN